MIQKLIGCCIGAGGIYLYSQDLKIWSVFIFILAVGVIWGESQGTWFYIPMRGWFRTQRSSASSGFDGCGADGDSGGGDGGGGD